MSGKPVMSGPNGRFVPRVAWGSRFPTAMGSDSSGRYGRHFLIESVHGGLYYRAVRHDGQVRSFKRFIPGL